MKLKTLFEKVSIPLLVMVSLCSCSRFIEGDVFLDKNANNVKDLDERAIPGLRFTITRENATRETGLTDVDGHFWVPIAPGDIDVNYCVQVRSEDVATLKALSRDGAKALKALDASPEATSEACPFILGQPDCNNENCCEHEHCSQASICEEKDAEDCAKTSDGEPDCSDKDCCDQSECSDASACKGESDSNACPKDSAGEPNCNDDRCSKEAACNTYTVKSMQACDQSKAAKLTLRLNVPVAMDYTTRVAKMDSRSPDPISVGDQFGIEITYPASCSFEPYTLPAAFVPIGLGEAFNPIPHELLLSRAIRNQPWQVIDRDLPPFGHDALFTYVLRLTAVSEEGLVEGKATIQPTLTCPDGKKTSASANIISFLAPPSE